MKRDPVLEVLDEITAEEIEEPIESPWRKFLFVLVAIFLAVLVFSLSFTSDALFGIIQSSTISVDQLVFKDATIIFTNNTLQQLQNEFITNEHREIKACLFGTGGDQHYIIDKVEFPKVLSASVTHINSIPCPINTLIDLHSHPINRCLASQVDVVSLSNRRTSNPELRMMIMCSSNRFALV